MWVFNLAILENGTGGCESMPAPFVQAAVVLASSEQCWYYADSTNACLPYKWYLKRNAVSNARIVFLVRWFSVALVILNLLRAVESFRFWGKPLQECVPPFTTDLYWRLHMLALMSTLFQFVFHVKTLGILCSVNFRHVQIPKHSVFTVWDQFPVNSVVWLEQRQKQVNITGLEITYWTNV